MIWIKRVRSDSIVEIRSVSITSSLLTYFDGELEDGATVIVPLISVGGGSICELEEAMSVSSHRDERWKQNQNAPTSATCVPLDLAFFSTDQTKRSGISTSRWVINAAATSTRRTYLTSLYSRRLEELRLQVEGQTQCFFCYQSLLRSAAHLPCSVAELFMRGLRVPVNGPGPP